MVVMVAGCGEVSDVAPVESCTPNEFVDCVGDTARICNPSGKGATEMACGAPGCNAEARRCNVCEPELVSCGSNTVERCGADGMPLAPDACDIGCTDSPAPHCTYIQPNYAALADVCDTPAVTPALVIDTTQTLDTNSDLVCNGGISSGVCIVRYGEITVNANRELTLVGNRAVALVADRGVTIDGSIDVSATGATSGPGGGVTISGNARDGTIGGGGAGFKTAGAPGGSGTTTGGGAAGGAAGTSPADLVSLVGGPRTGIGGILTMRVDAGGGGAITLIACRGTVLVSATGIIDAGGGGGDPGCDSVLGAQIMFYAGSGGGAGGNIVLQGAGVSVLGSVFANGGGGGGGTGVNDQCGAAGEGGTRSATIAARGGLPSAGGGAGGAGGRRGASPINGNGAGGSGPTAGGGGGSTGFVQTYTPVGVVPTLTPAAASPAPEPNRQLLTR